MTWCRSCGRELPHLDELCPHCLPGMEIEAGAGIPPYVYGTKELIDKIRTEADEATGIPARIMRKMVEADARGRKAFRDAISRPYEMNQAPETSGPTVPAWQGEPPWV